MKKLRIALSKKEKAEQLLSKLEKLQERDEVDAAHYEALEEEYTALLDEGNAEFEKITQKLSERLAKCRDHLGAYAQEQADLEVRIKVGELSEKKNRGRLKKLRKRVRRLEKQVEKLETLVNATSSKELGGFVDIPLKQTAAGRARKRR